MTDVSIEIVAPTAESTPTNAMVGEIPAAETGSMVATRNDDASAGIVEVLIADIKPGENRRAVNKDMVEQLAKSIQLIGLQNPITITKGNFLIAGQHRIEAYKKLGNKTIPCIIMDVDADHARLAEIDENLMRNELTVLDRGLQLLERKNIYEKLYPQAKRGGDRKSQKISGQEAATDSFVTETAKKSGRGATAIKEDVAIAKDLDPNVIALLRNTSVANHKGILQKLARSDKADQMAIAEQITKGEKPVWPEIEDKIKGKDIEPDQPAVPEPLATAPIEGTLLLVGPNAETGLPQVRPIRLAEHPQLAAALAEAGFGVDKQFIIMADVPQEDAAELWSLVFSKKGEQHE